MSSTLIGTTKFFIYMQQDITKKILKWGVVAAFALLAIITVSGFISFSNTEVEYKNQFKQKFDQRTTVYDNLIVKATKQTTELTLRNDSSFRQNVQIYMEGRKDAQNVLMKWIQESNPNANYSEVASLYRNLARLIESTRRELIEHEKYLQDIALQHSNLIDKFPGTVYNAFLNRSRIVYKPISSTRTDKVIETGKDDEIKLF
jgi:hypothetical protein